MKLTTALVTLALTCINLIAQVADPGEVATEQEPQQLDQEVQETDLGSVTTTTVKGTAAANRLQACAVGMRKRLKSGLRERVGDPVFREIVGRLDEIDIQIERIAQGVSVTLSGKTDEAKVLARDQRGDNQYNRQPGLGRD